MKKLLKLSINNEKLLKREELIHLTGGATTEECDGRWVQCCGDGIYYSGCSDCVCEGKNQIASCPEHTDLTAC